MVISKKDRIVLAVSFVIIFIGGSSMLSGHDDSTGTVIILVTLLYWGYRFIKNDISFLNIKDK